jgi:azurin
MEELTELLQTLWKDEMLSKHAYAELLNFTNTHDSKQLLQTAVVGQGEQLKCDCKKAKFTRTVDSDYNPLCGYCGHII